MRAIVRRARRLAGRALAAVGVRRERPSFGLNRLDHKLLPYLRKRNGVFVEAGANDGLSQSNTAYLERFRGWRGLLVEPIPGLAEKCRSNRPHAIVEQCALVPFGYPEPDIEMHYSNLMSLVRGARGSDEGDMRHLAEGSRYLKADDVTYSLKVPVGALSDLLDRHGIEDIDFLSLDVEGFEAQALQGMDFLRHRPKYILVEANDRTAVEAILGLYYDLHHQLSHHDLLYRLR